MVTAHAVTVFEKFREETEAVKIRKGVDVVLSLKKRVLLKL